jgi:hypothetical protein
LTTLQSKLEEADARTKELVDDNKSLETQLNDLEYELGINEMRLPMGESIKVDFYERHWATVQEIFEENRFKTALIKDFKTRFSRRLARTPSATPILGPEALEDQVGPEFIDLTNALYRMVDEAREGRGDNGLRRSNLDREKIKAIHGHGPAGYKPRPEQEMPKGYPERRAALEIERLEWQIKELRGQLWRSAREYGNDLVEEEEWETEGEVAGIERERGTNEVGMSRPVFLNSV